MNEEKYNGVYTKSENFSNGRYFWKSETTGYTIQCRIWNFKLKNWTRSEILYFENVGSDEFSNPDLVGAVSRLGRFGLDHFEKTGETGRTHFLRRRMEPSRHTKLDDLRNFKGYYNEIIIIKIKPDSPYPKPLESLTLKMIYIYKSTSILP